MKMPSQKGTFSFRIHSFDVDYKGHLFLHHLLRFLQESAYIHANENNFGYDFLKTENKFWVLSRISMEIKQLPKWDDEIQVTTWTSGPEGLFAKREFQLSVNGQLYVSVSSCWLVVDGW